MTTVLRADGVWVTTSPEPDVLFPFRDTDRDLGYTEYPTLRDTEIRSAADVLIARLVRVLYALDSQVETQSGGLTLGFDQPGSLVPTASGWVAGTAAALTYDTGVKTHGTSSLQIALTNLATATTSTQTKADSLRLATLYTDLLAVTTFTIQARRSAGPAGLAVKLRFVFSGNAANYAEFDITPSANNVAELKTLARATPAATGGTVNWAQVSGIEIRVSHTAGSNQSFNIYVDELRALTSTIETITKRRARYDDTAGVRSDYSDYASIKYSALPTLSSVLPAVAATITDPTPTWSWVYAHTGGIVQASFQLIAKLGQTILYDSGLVPGAAAGHTMPPDRLPNNADIDWTLTVYNADGLYATVSRTFHTTFTQPPALAGLVVVQSIAEKALIASWTPSSLSAAEFVSYLVYAKPEGGQFRLVTTITDKAATSLYYRAAGHNRETTIRVTQTNGWMESEPAEASATLEGDGIEWDGAGEWLLAPPYVIQLLDAKGPPEREGLIREEFAPPGRGETIVLSWGSTGYEGDLTVYLQSIDEVELIRDWARDGTVVMLKFEDGRVRYVKLTVGDAVQVAGELYTLPLRYGAVSPDNADF